MLAMNWFDLLLFLLLIGGLAVGYYQGLWRQLIGLAALYLGAIVASQYYHLLGNGLKNSLTTTPGMVLNAIAFFAIMVVVVVVLNVLALDATKMIIRLPSLVDHLGGMLLGLIGAWIALTIAVSILLVITLSGWADADGARQFIYLGVRNSLLAQATQSSLPTLLNSIKPWLPGGIPNIFSL